jgi:hypothetical protein
MSVPGVSEADAAELALRVVAHRGTAVYMAYITSPDAIDAVLADVGDEIAALDPAARLETLRPEVGEVLVDALAATDAEIVLVHSSAFTAPDWALLDRRRSSIAHRGVLIFVTTPASFDALMRSAPNLASWLGADVFAHASDAADLDATRVRRLEALRRWAAQPDAAGVRSDADVIREAEQGTLARDPEYAEWLVLLGRGDLLGPRER